MSTWKAAFLASKFLGLFVFIQAILGLRGLTDRPYGDPTWHGLVVPGVLLVMAIGLWSLADLIANRVARSSFMWGAFFAQQEELDYDEEEPATVAPRTRPRTLDLTLIALIALGVILLLTLIWEALREEPYSGGILLGTADTGIDWMPVALAALTILGAGTILVTALIRRRRLG